MGACTVRSRVCKVMIACYVFVSESETLLITAVVKIDGIVRGVRPVLTRSLLS